MSKVNWWLVMAGTGIVALIVILFLLPIRLSSARDFGQSATATHRISLCPWRQKNRPFKYWFCACGGSEFAKL
jgi:hypothetical protein